MKTRTLFPRVLSLMLAAVLVLGYALPARATGEIPLELIQVDNAVVTAPAPMKPMETPEAQLDPNELVRVSIQLAPTPESVENIPQEGGLSWQEIYEKKKTV